MRSCLAAEALAEWARTGTAGSGTRSLMRAARVSPSTRSGASLKRLAETRPLPACRRWWRCRRGTPPASASTQSTTALWPARSTAIEVNVDHVEIGERAGPPRLQAVFQRGHDARHRALREGRGLEQWLERTANPAGVATRQVRGDDRFIDFRHSPLIARDDHRRPFFRAGASEEDGTRQRERYRTGRARERPLPDSIVVITPRPVALVGSRLRGWPAVPRGRPPRSRRTW